MDKVDIYEHVEVLIIIDAVLYQSVIMDFSTNDHILIKSYKRLSSIYNITQHNMIDL